jgi:hypothetical protein
MRAGDVDVSHWGRPDVALIFILFFRDDRAKPEQGNIRCLMRRGWRRTRRLFTAEIIEVGGLLRGPAHDRRSPLRRVTPADLILIADPGFITAIYNRLHLYHGSAPDFINLDQTRSAISASRWSISVLFWFGQ